MDNGLDFYDGATATEEDGTPPSFVEHAHGCERREYYIMVFWLAKTRAKMQQVRMHVRCCISLHAFFLKKVQFIPQSGGQCRVVGKHHFPYTLESSHRRSDLSGSRRGDILSRSKDVCARGASQKSIIQYRGTTHTHYFVQMQSDEQTTAMMVRGK